MHVTPGGVCMSLENLSVIMSIFLSGLARAGRSVSLVLMGPSGRGIGGVEF